MTSGPDRDSRELSTHTKNTPAPSAKKSGREIFVFLATVIIKSYTSISLDLFGHLWDVVLKSLNTNFPPHYVNILPNFGKKGK